jgi:hypothetical protein
MDLSKIKRIIVHGNCHDGMASAILLYDALRIEPEFIIHGTKEYVEMEATEGMLFCDITPPEDRYEEFIKAGAIVLDHHIGVKYIVEAFGENGVFADEEKDPGVSGALLAFREVWLPKYYHWLSAVGEPCALSPYKESLELLATLAGIKDTWQKHNSRWHEAGAQTCMLTFYSWEYWKRKIGDYYFSEEMEVGRMIYEDRMLKAEKLADKAFVFKVVVNDSGYKIAIFNDPDRYTSDVSEILRNRGVNVVAGFFYTKRPSDENPLICFSIRTDGSINASDLAKTIPGGGGHTKAAGFSETIDLGEINAYAAFRDIFIDYISYYKD